MTPWSVTCRSLLRLATAALLIGSTLGSWGSMHFVLDLLSHFRGQYFASLAVLIALLWRLKSPRWAALALLGVIHNGVVIGPYYLPHPVADKSATAPLSMISFNVHTANRHSREVLEYLRAKDADLVLLSEVDHRWIRELRPLLNQYSYTVLAPEADNFGIALYSKLPLLKQETIGLGPDQPLTICAEMEFQQQRIQFIGTHPLPPMRYKMARLRDEQLTAIAKRVAMSKQPTIIAGDLNATPWCAGFQPLLAAGLIDTALGFGMQRTWNARLPGSWIPIDHILATREFITRRRTVGPNCGSDHYAIEADLMLR